jgi:hypothetical protein
LVRYFLDELDLVQFMSSAGGQSLRMLEQMQSAMLSRALSTCRTDRERFDAAKAGTALRDLWATEHAVLGDGSLYWADVAGRGLDGEVHPTERNWVDQDYLGHFILCVLANCGGEWLDYTLQHHRSEIERVAQYGSWQARALLGLEPDIRLQRPSDDELARRFFNGDLALFMYLRAAYSNGTTRG